MRRLLVPALVVVLLATPTLVPTIRVTTDDPAPSIPACPESATLLACRIGDLDINVSRGGEAYAWNLIYELCKAGVPGMCDLYMDGQGEGWWQ
jgi:hypothetical protein